MPLPLIGIPTSKRTNGQGVARLGIEHTYLRAVRTAGGYPVLLPIEPEPQRLPPLLERLDGLLLPGGGDLEPSLYGQPARHPLRSVDPERDAFEIALARLAAARQLPLLAICRGMQVLNVALGGSLHQHLPAPPATSILHDNPLTTYARHAVQLLPHSATRALLGQPSLQVNSHHHQAVDRLGQGLRVAARAPDGVVEAVELEGHPFAIGVQWHPERMRGMEALFRGLTSTAARR